MCTSRPRFTLLRLLRNLSPAILLVPAGLALGQSSSQGSSGSSLASSATSVEVGSSLWNIMMMSMLPRFDAPSSRADTARRSLFSDAYLESRVSGDAVSTSTSKQRPGKKGQAEVDEYVKRAYPPLTDRESALLRQALHRADGLAADWLANVDSLGLPADLRARLAMTADRLRAAQLGLETKLRRGLIFEGRMHGEPIQETALAFEAKVMNTGSTDLGSSWKEQLIVEFVSYLDSISTK